MKRFLCIFAAAVLMFALSSCGKVGYEDSESYFKISFPKDMKVFVMSDFSTEVDQGDAHYIYIEFSSVGTDVVDTLYMTTVKNGLQYSIMYYAPGMTENDMNEGQSIFDTAYITRTISNTETQEQADSRVRNATLAMIAVVILIIVVVAVGFAKHAGETKRRKDNGEYNPQFNDDLK